MHPDAATAGPSGSALPLALAAEPAACGSTAQRTRTPEVRTSATSRGRRAARRRTAAVRG
ncbi:hypothetical protein ABZV68_03770 [Streptomyces clavifer]|uniref:hypothetical protein n=1 Tax=Streptomyces TaxID=1883 RepID=UPI0029B12D22|nr:hypothetical protein [Streptomyces sp. ND04-05B]MDX3064091.1 hypothetical protein [Streptomyces sp. ND04-05B]